MVSKLGLQSANFARCFLNTKKDFEIADFFGNLGMLSSIIRSALLSLSPEESCSKLIFCIIVMKSIVLYH